MAILFALRIIDLVSHTTYVACVFILYISASTYSLKWTANDRFFEKFVVTILFYSHSFCQKSAERKSPKKHFLYFYFKVWPGS